MTKRPSVFAGLEIPTESPAKGRKKAAPTAAKVERTAKPSENEADFFRTSLYLSRAVHDKLREIAFHENIKVHDLFIEGLDKVLTKRGYPTTQEIRNGIKA